MAWDVTKPADTDLVRNFPALNRGDKSTLQAELQVEHDVLPASGSGSGRHKFPMGDSASRPASPPAGAIYFNTGLAAIERFSGSVWEQRATLIPQGTRMVFDQDAAPTGWTRDTSINDRVVRIVGGARTHPGSWTVGGLTTGSHSHGLANHKHEVPVGMIPWNMIRSWPHGGSGQTQQFDRPDGNGANVPVETLLSGPPTVGSTDPATATVNSDGSWRPLSRDMIIATKD